MRVKARIVLPRHDAAERDLTTKEDFAGLRRRGPEK
jgi:hypothetical protein